MFSGPGVPVGRDGSSNQEELMAKMPSAAMEDLVPTTMKLVIIDFVLIIQNALSQTILISISLETNANYPHVF